MTMYEQPLVSIHVVVRNGEHFIRHCLDAVSEQTYRNVEVCILDNASTDTTAAIIEVEYPQYRLIRHDTNLGMWPGQEHLLAHSKGAFVCSLSVDVILDARFIESCVEAMQDSPLIGAIQGKLYQYALEELKEAGHAALRRDMIDTCGFSLTRARRVMNIGHGECDSATLNVPKDIFGVEGAVPFFRRSALEDCRIDGTIWDPDFFWYGDDLDVAWRMTLFGYRQRYEPRAVAWHDRSTTKGAATTPILGQLQRRALRSRIPLVKRRLDWSNMRFTIIKNDYTINVLRDLPFILAREAAVLGYIALFEPAVLLEMGRFLRLLPRMVHRRMRVLRRARVASSAIHSWFL